MCLGYGTEEELRRCLKGFAECRDRFGTGARRAGFKLTDGRRGDAALPLKLRLRHALQFPR
ncbi:hypothetical protein GCM10009619_18980 [Williamsia maris]